MMKIWKSYVLCVEIKYLGIIMVSSRAKAARVFLSERSKTKKGTHA